MSSIDVPSEMEAEPSSADIPLWIPANILAYYDAFSLDSGYAPRSSLGAYSDTGG